MKRRSFMWVLVCLALAMGAAVQPAPRTATVCKVQEIKLGVVDAPEKNNFEYSISPDGAHLAFVATLPQVHVVVDGVAQPEGDSHLPAYSPDGRHVALLIHPKEDDVLTLDGKVLGGEHNGQQRGPLTFSPDSRHVAYAAVIGTADGAEHEFMVLDGQAGPMFDEIDVNLHFDPPRISPDGSRLAYWARRGRKWMVVVDGKPGMEYDKILEDSFLFSSDGKHFAYAAEQGDNRIVVVDGREDLDDFIDVHSPVFSADGKHYLYQGAYPDPEGWVVVVDGKAGAAYQHNGDTEAMFSPDGKRVAYTTHTTGPDMESVVLDGKAGPGVSMNGNQVGNLVFSPDSKRFAYVVWNGADSYAVLDGQKLPGGSGVVFSPDSQRIALLRVKVTQTELVVDGKTIAEVGRVRGVVFSPDSKRIAYTARRGDRTIVAVDGQVGPEWDRVADVTFTADSRHVYYKAWRGKACFLVVDAQAGPSMEALDEPIVSADCRHIACVARDGDRDFMILDGQVGTPYDRILSSGKVMRFNADGAAEFFGIRANTVYRVKQTRE